MPDHPTPPELAQSIEERVEARVEEETRPTVISRAFILKSARPESIKERVAQGVRLEDLNFVYNVMGLKGEEAKNPNQLMPLGGKIETREGVPMWQGESLTAKIEAETARELLEEGYARGMDYRLLGRQKYLHEGKPKQQVLSVARVSPFDEEYQLHPKEDKFATYVSFDMDETKSLFAAGAVILGEKRAQLVDALNAAGVDKEGKAGPVENLKKRQIEQIQQRFLNSFEQAEFEKKKAVLATLVNLYAKDLNIIDPNPLLARIEEAKDYPSVQSLYHTVVTDRKVTQDQLLASLSLTNLTEELRYLDERGSEIETALRILAILPDLEKVTPHQIDALKRSKQLAPALLPLLDRLTEEQNQLDLFEDDRLTRDSLVRLDSFNEAHKERAKKILEERFGISAKHYYEIGQLYDTFIDEISQTAIADRLSNEFNISLVEQLNDVVNCDPIRLLQTAAGVGGAVEKYRRENSGGYARLVFEARRKLFTMSRINKVMEYYAREREQSDTPLAHVWDSLQSIPRTTEVQRVLSPNGRLVDVLTARTPHELKDRYAQMAERGEVVLSDAQIDSTRDMYLNGGKLVAMRVFERPLKAKGSTIRKMMLGDVSLTDIFARALIIDTDDAALLQRETRTVEVLKDVDAPILETEAREANDHAVVFRLLERFKEKAREELGADWKCAVGKYTPTPEGEDYQYSGKRAGTGGRIRLAKFVLVLECCDGRRYKEEVQVFTPMPGRKSGYYFFQEKAKDDERYQVDRLLARQGIRSLVEQMFPHAIYKPIPTVHRKQASNH